MHWDAQRNATPTASATTAGEEFIETGKIKRLEEFRPKITKEEWDAFIEYHEPLRQCFLEEELLMDFEEYKVVITCGYHEREFENELTGIIESNPDEYPDELRVALLHKECTPVYDIEKLKRSIQKYEFSLGCVHEEYIFEGCLKDKDIKTHPVSMVVSTTQPTPTPVL